MILHTYELNLQLIFSTNAREKKEIILHIYEHTSGFFIHIGGKYIYITHS
jgi:hypothetical protein